MNLSNLMPGESRKKISRLLCVTALSTCSVFAYAQQQQVKLTGSNLPLKSVFKQIEKQTDLSIDYRSQDVDDSRIVKQMPKATTVQQVMNQLLAGTDCVVTFSNGHIIIKKQVSNIANQQSKLVKGTIVDAMGMPVIGANVMVKGTTNGTITDMDGNFSLEADNNTILVVSYIGFANQEIKVGNQTNLAITMKEDAEALDELVVVGFGTQKKVNLTGAVSNVSSEAFENRSVSNVSQALQGKLPGLNIQQTQGYLDATPSISIRGTGTIGEGSSSSPLVLIDGIEGDMNRLNPQDIESVSVLKDAAASSIYGSRAPFGVILITTKKGKSGKFSVNYNNSFRWNKSINMPRSVDSYTFATYYNEAATNAGQAGHFTPEHLQKIKDYLDGKITGGVDPDPNNPTRWADTFNTGYANTDWMKLIFDDTTFNHEHNLSVSGGNEKLQMYASANYLNQDGFIRLNPESNQRFSTNLKITSQFNKWLHLNYNVKFNQIDFEKPTAFTDGLFNNMSRLAWPTLIAYDPNGYLYGYASHALWLRDGGRYKKKTNEMIQQLNFIIEPIKDWKIIGDVNYKLYHERIHTDWQKVYNHDVNGNPYPAVTAEYNPNSYISESYLGTKYLNVNVYTEYLKEIGKHSFKGMIGGQFERLWQDDFNASRLGVILSNIYALDATTGNDFYGVYNPPTVGGAYDEWATAGYFGRLNYHFDNRYLLEVNLRYDGTSRFRADKRWRWFPSVSMGWNIANEEFFAPWTNYISTLKIRTSYGLLGNQNTTNWYPTYAVMPIGSTNSSWLINGNQCNTSAAPALISSTMGWETVKSLNVGLDINALNNRLSLSAEWFTRKTEDMIGPAPEMPVILGTTVPKTNNTSLRTNGFEIAVSWRDRFENGLGYNVGFNLSDAATKILEYPNNTGVVTNYYSGKNMGEIWGFETVGIAKTQEEMDAHLASLPNGGQSALGNNWAAGDIMYRDLNGDGKIDKGSSRYGDLGDLKVIGNEMPRYLFGLNLGMDYKGFDASIFFQGVMKRDYFTGSYDFWGAESIWSSTCFEQHLDYFRDDENHLLGLNLDSYYPRPLFDTSKNKYTQTRYLLDASYIRLKNVSIGYTVPKKLIDKWKLENLRIYVIGENLWTGTKLTDLYDPETISSNPAGLIKYPMSAVYSFGLSITY